LRLDVNVDRKDELDLCSYRAEEAETPLAALRAVLDRAVAISLGRMAMRQVGVALAYHELGWAGEALTRHLPSFVAPRRIALLRSGHRHGELTRLITPWDIGELTRPFLFLGYSEQPPGTKVVVGAQPGIATLTLVLSGALAFEHASGNKGMVVEGGFKWTTPGEVVWHTAGATGEPLRAFHVWLEQSQCGARSGGESGYIRPHEVPEEGPVRVVLGQLGQARSPLARATANVNYFHVRLRGGQRWRYVAPEDHNVTWLATDRGSVRLQGDGRIVGQQIALFEDSGGVIEVQADGESSFVLGSTRRGYNTPVPGDRHPIDTTLSGLGPWPAPEEK